MCFLKKQLISMFAQIALFYTLPMLKKISHILNCQVGNTACTLYHLRKKYESILSGSTCDLRGKVPSSIGETLI